MGFGENLSSTWIPADIALTSNFSCWNFSCNSRGYSWLGMVAALCEAATREKADGQTWVLICDGHGSHVNADFIRHCREHDIVLLILPPHSSHLTQPLNVAVFGPLKKAMAVELQHIIHTEVLRIQKAEWMSAYVRARTRALSSSNIISAFSGAGLFPFSPSKILRRIPEIRQVWGATTRSNTRSSNYSKLAHRSFNVSNCTKHSFEIYERKSCIPYIWRSEFQGRDTSPQRPPHFGLYSTSPQRASLQSISLVWFDIF